MTHQQRVLARQQVCGQIYTKRLIGDNGRGMLARVVCGKPPRHFGSHESTGHTMPLLESDLPATQADEYVKTLLEQIRVTLAVSAHREMVDLVRESEEMLAKVSERAIVAERKLEAALVMVDRGEAKNAQLTRRLQARSTLKLEDLKLDELLEELKRRAGVS